MLIAHCTTHCSGNVGSDGTYSRNSEVREVRPVAELRGIAADADPVRVRGRRAVKDEDLVPAWRRDERVRGRDHRARRARARELGEERTHVHRVA